MKALTSLAAIAALVGTSAASAQAVTGVEGITPITLQNVQPQCVNINKHSVTLIITGVNVAKKDTLLKKVRGAGGKTEVQLISTDPAKTYSYPAEAALNVQDLGDGIISAPIAMTILGQYDFNADGGFREVQIPFYLLKREGESDVAKYSRALIEFTAKNGSAIPVPGLATAAGMVKDLSDGFFSQLDEARSSQVKDPDFRVAYQLSGTDVCPGAQFLHSGIFGQIRDTKLTGVGIIKTASQDDYCFYVFDPAAPSPRIGYVKRSGTCATARPADLTPLNNPQMIYVVLAPAKATAGKLATLVVREDSNKSTSAKVGARAAALSLLRANPALPRVEVSAMAEICELAGLAAVDCFAKVAPPRDR